MDHVLCCTSQLPHEKSPSLGLEEGSGTKECSGLDKLLQEGRQAAESSPLECLDCQKTLVLNQVLLPNLSSAQLEVPALLPCPSSWRLPRTAS